MGVRKFRSVDSMPGVPPRRPLDPENLRLAFEVSDTALRLARVRRVPGVRKARSLELLEEIATASPRP